MSIIRMYCSGRVAHLYYSANIGGRPKTISHGLPMSVSDPFHKMCCLVVATDLRVVNALPPAEQADVRRRVSRFMSDRMHFEAPDHYVDRIWSQEVVRFCELDTPFFMCAVEPRVRYHVTFVLEIDDDAPAWKALENLIAAVKKAG